MIKENRTVNATSSNSTISTGENSTLLALNPNITSKLDPPQTAKTSDDGRTRFEWDKHDQNLLLGCFFWGYVLTELPGGRMAEIVGARKIFGGGMLGASLLTLLTPVVAYWGLIPSVILRSVMGFFLGATWPAIPPMAAKWIPPMERSKFIANMMASALGAAITMPVCGYLIDRLGWASTFYVTGAVGLVWSVSWFFLVFDSPADHPRISAEERLEIETKIAEGSGKGQKPKNVPWIALITSLPVWAIIITHGCSVFGYFTVVNQLPTYMKEVLHFNVKANGLLSSLPYLGKYVMAVIASYAADRLRRSGRYSTTLIRKGFTTFAVAVPALFMIVQAFFGYDATISVTIFTGSLFFNGAVTAGYLANGLDIAPNFSGTIFGLANTLSSFGGFVSTSIVAALTNKNSTFTEWRNVFWVLVGVYAFGGIVYLIFGSGNLQPWNSVERKPSMNGTNGAMIQEMEPLKKKKDEEAVA
ncbi:solute carrier family 17 [Holotrichia oblita]|uniref:Solute carrier family 17 n=1 Tax=Holotrichia oblita TaxID=644536 RepID=A0ACB9STI7_HOLOL|nr:solute carrier family 17 [Holotrichia oblita]